MKVMLIERRGPSVVVEYEDGGFLQRRIVPMHEVVGGEVEAEILGRGIPYGDSFADAMADVDMPTPETIADALHRQNLWTGEDLRADPATVHLALREALGDVLVALLDRTNPKRRRRAAHGD